MITQEEIDAVTTEEITEYRNREYQKEIDRAQGKNLFTSGWIEPWKARYNQKEPEIRASIVKERQVAKIIAENMIYGLKNLKAD